MKRLMMIVLFLGFSTAQAVTVAAGEYRLCAPMFFASEVPTLIFNFRTRQQVKVRLTGPKADSLTKQLAGKQVPSRQAYSFRVDKVVKSGEPIEGVLLRTEDCGGAEPLVKEVINNLRPRTAI
jgi:hypothetical protein